MFRIFALLLCIICSTSALAGEVNIKPGSGFQLSSANDEFHLKIRPRVQLRYTSKISDPSSVSDLTHSLQIRRARLATKGYFFGEHNSFKFELGFSPRDMSFNKNYLIPTSTPILDAYFEFKYFRDLSVRVGQFKVPFNRQRVVSSGNLQMVDRSLSNSEFNLDRDIGLSVFSKDLLGWNAVRYYAGVYLGKGRNVFQLDYVSLMYLARVEVLPIFGLCDDYTEGDLEISGDPCLSIGTAYAFLPQADKDRGIKGNTPSDLGTTAIHVATADVVGKWHGFSLFSEVFGRYGFRQNGNTGPFEEARNGYGGSIQIGKVSRLRFNSWLLELVVRYSFIRSHIRGVDIVSSMPNRSELGIGSSLYLGGHSLKIQSDMFRLWNNKGSDLLSINEFSSGDIVLRLQVQGAF